MRLKKEILLLICSFLAYSQMQSVEANIKKVSPQLDIEQNNKGLIRVLLGRNISQITLEAQGKYHIYNLPDNHFIFTGEDTEKAHLKTTSNGLKWNILFPAAKHIKIVPEDGRTSIIFNGKQYKGCLEIYTNEDQTFNVISELDVESYLHSTLSKKMTSQHSKPVLECIAILQRTHIYYQIHKNRYSSWHMEATADKYEGYGVCFRDLLIDKAIEETKYMILSYHGLPFPAVWHSNSAGETAEYASIFRKETPSPLGVKSKYALQDKERFSWSFSINQEHLAKLLQMPEIKSLQLYVDKSTQRVYGVKALSTNESKQLSFFQFQDFLGSNKLLSNCFTVKKKGHSVVFHGYGEGHGVGLCLHSADVMSKEGFKVEQILSFFYPKTKLTSIKKMIISDYN
ncbi:MAG: SpoIID/LytB domain-containing protein [Rhabdochlamydiaceae bacterium]